MSFYITLPSNASMELFSKNTLTNYTTQLPIPLKFDVPYEVALVEMIFRQSWSIDLGYFEYHTNNRIISFPIKAIDGDFIQNILNDINKNLEEKVLKIKEEILKENGIPNDRFKDELENFKNSNEMPRLLFYHSVLKFQCPQASYFRFVGPIRGLFELINDWHDANTPPIILNKINLHFVEALHVYCDIIDLQFTGDTKSQLIRTVVVSNNYHSLVSVNYENPHYVAVNQNHINTINIDIRSDTGNHIHFFDGKVIVKLHFRPMRYGF